MLSQKNQEITDSITYARRIQEAILPSQSLFTALLKDAFVIYKPKDIVAGDFYLLEKLQGYLVCAVADCTGHGVPGAMMSVACSNSLKRSVKEFGLVDAGRILDKTRELIIESFSAHEAGIKDGMDISLAVLEPRSLKLTWSGANNPLLILRQNELIEYKADKQPVGHHVKQGPFTTNSIQLADNDCLYFFSDGFQDQFGGPKQKKYSSKALRQLLKTIHQQPMDRQRKTLDEEFTAWKSDYDQVDDVCIIGIRVSSNGFG
jgi:serine phosphatase RsbU (regulator of sigma subunit)